MAKAKPETAARKSMKSLGIYKPEFEPVIKIYAELMKQYGVLTEEYVTSKYDYSEATAQGSKKAPIVTTLETLRKDILAYASQLGLTPQGLLRADDKAFSKKTSSALAAALKELNSE